MTKNILVVSLLALFSLSSTLSFACDCNLKNKVTTLNPKPKPKPVN